MKISIIIVNFNTKDFLDKCLESIYDSVISRDQYEVIVVDNYSSDDSIESLNTKYTQVRWIRLKQNVGFSRANNIGIQNSGQSEYIFFLNPDTIINKYTLIGLVRFMDNYYDAGISTPYVSLPDGNIDDACHRGFPTPWNAITHFTGLGKKFPNSKIFNGYHLGYSDMDISHEIDACAGAAMFIRREAGNQIGWWDEDYFWYGEDLDFCYRAKLFDWKIMFLPEYKALHYKGVSGGIKEVSSNISTATRETKIMAQSARFEAMRIFYRKHYTDKYPKLLTWLVLRGIEALERIKRI
jgi:GT2 family glycosyltransferase